MSRPVLALILFGVYLGVNFGLTTLHQLRTTGSTGFRGISGRPGSPAWLGGVLFVVALVLCVLAIVLELLGVVKSIIAPSAALVRAGAVTAVLGVALTFWAQMSMGRSWRIGVKQDERTELITSGPFRWVRNPIFSFMLLTGAGIATVVPNALSLASFGCLFVAVELQVRVVEEPYLFKTHGRGYANYCARVGRFVPALGHRRFGGDAQSP